MMRVKISQDKTMKIDNEDFGKFSLCKWFYNTNGYARGTIKGKKVYFHRFIMPPPIGLETDHINGNKLDNRKINLRHVSRSENNYNRKPGLVDSWWSSKRKRRIAGRNDPTIQYLFK